MRRARYMDTNTAVHAKHESYRKASLVFYEKKRKEEHGLGEKGRKAKHNVGTAWTDGRTDGRHQG